MYKDRPALGKATIFALLLVAIVLTLSCGTNPTGPGTLVVELAANINSSGDSNPAELAAYNGVLYFQADDGIGSTGNELWSFDGNSASLAYDINTESGGSNPTFLVVFKNKLYFGADDGSVGRELWCYDDITTTATIVQDINPGDATSHALSYSTEFFAIFNDTLYFRADNGTNGFELWEYAGSGVASQIPYEINPLGGNGFPFYPAVFGSKLYFGAQDGSTPYYLTVFDGVLYFQATNGSDGTELWQYTGIVDPSMVDDINTSGDSLKQINYFTIFNDELYFVADGGSGDGFELWVCNGTNSPSEVADINPSGDSNPQYLTVFNNVLFFGADDGTNGMELWQYNGNDPPSLVEDINPGADPSNPKYLTVCNGKLYFQANNGSDTELWMVYYQ